MSNPGSFTRILTAGARVALAVCLATGAAAQRSEETGPATVSLGGGFTGVVGQDAGMLDHGGNSQLGAGYFNDYLGITAAFSFNGLGITGRELDGLNQPDGNARVYSLTVDPVLRFPLRNHWSVYVLGSGGYVHSSSLHSRS